MRYVWCVLLCAACGDDAPARLDANEGTPDAALDAPDSLTPITVTALSMASDGLPDAAAIGIFVGPDGIEHESTADATGHLSGVLPQGGTLTVIHGGSTGTSALITVVRGVRPGDALTVGRPLRAFFTGPDDVTMQITVPAVSGGATSYEIKSVSHSQGVTPGVASSFGFPPGAHGATASLLAIATVSASDHRYIHEPALPVSNGGAATLTGTWQTMASADVSAIVPAGWTTGAMFRGIVVDRGVSETMRQSITGGATTATVTAPTPVGAGLAAVAGASVTFADGNSIGVLRQDAASTQNMALTIAAMPVFTTKPAYANNAVTWTEAHAGSPDARVMVGIVSYAKSGGGMVVTQLFLVDDGATPNIPMPALPARFNTTGVMGTPSVGVYYADVDTLAGYDAARPYTSLLIDAGNNPTLPRPFSLTRSSVY